MRHDLPSGAWLEIKPVQDLKGKDADRYRRAVRMMLPRTTEGDLDVKLGVALGIDTREVKRDAAIACFVTAWSYLGDDDAPLPVPELADSAVTSRESVGDYPLDDARAIDDIIRPYLTKLDPPDPKETTTSSSNGRSKAKAASLTD